MLSVILRQQKTSVVINKRSFTAVSIIAAHIVKFGHIYKFSVKIYRIRLSSRNYLSALSEPSIVAVVKFDGYGIRLRIRYGYSCRTVFRDLRERRTVGIVYIYARRVILFKSDGLNAFVIRKSFDLSVGALVRVHYRRNFYLSVVYPERERLSGSVASTLPHSILIGNERYRPRTYRIIVT